MGSGRPKAEGVQAFLLALVERMMVPAVSSMLQTCLHDLLQTEEPCDLMSVLPTETKYCLWKGKIVWSWVTQRQGFWAFLLPKFCKTFSRCWDRKHHCGARCYFSLSDSCQTAYNCHWRAHTDSLACCFRFNTIFGLLSKESDLSSQFPHNCCVHQFR